MKIKWFLHTREMWRVLTKGNDAQIVVAFLFLLVAPILDILYLPIDIVRRDSQYRSVLEE